MNLHKSDDVIYDIIVCIDNTFVVHVASFINTAKTENRNDVILIKKLITGFRKKRGT